MRRIRIQKWFGWWPLMLIALFTGSAGGFAFSLLGPYADWMDVPKGYRTPGDIGGPMNIGEGYRWNLPVVTYPVQDLVAEIPTFEDAPRFEVGHDHQELYRERTRHDFQYLSDEKRRHARGG